MRLLALAALDLRDVRRINSNVPPDLEALHRRVFDAFARFIRAHFLGD